MAITPEMFISGSALLALGSMVLAFILLLVVGLYVYFALVWMTVAKKLKYDKAWLAWIPIVQLVLFPILAKKKESAWPWVFIFLVPIVNAVFLIIWTWVIFERRKYPGWLALVPLVGIIPFVGLFAGIANLIIWGLVAWSDR
jgi:hypothetical protein